MKKAVFIGIIALGLAASAVAVYLYIDWRNGIHAERSAISLDTPKLVIPTEDKDDQSTADMAKAQEIIESLPAIKALLSDGGNHPEYTEKDGIYVFRCDLADGVSAFLLAFKIDLEAGTATLTDGAPHGLAAAIKALQLTKGYVISKQPQSGSFFTYTLIASAGDFDAFSVLVYGYDDTVKKTAVSQEFYDVLNGNVERIEGEL